jgi:outer membrane protein TolC
MQTHLPFSSVTLLLLALLCVCAPTAAIELDQAIELALARDEGLNAMAKRQTALNEASIADSSLSDPELFFGVEGIPVNDPLAADMMTMYMVGLRQQFPPGQTRQLQRQRGQSLATVVVAEAELRRLEIAREVRRTWLAWTAASARLKITEESLAAFEELVSLSEARYRSGTGRQRDVDLARLERALLARSVLDAQSTIDESASDLARWTGQLPRTTAPDLPAWSVEVDEQQMLIDARHHPAIQVDELRINAGRVNTDLARQAYRPMWMVEGGYGHQRGSNPMTGGRQSDKLFAMVSLSLPIFTGQRQDRRVAAAKAEVDALAHQRALRLQEWEGRILSQLTRLERQRARLELIEDTILPDARRTLESTLSAYRSDQASFDELVRARLAKIDQMLEGINTRLAWLKARSELAFLGAEDPS